MDSSSLTVADSAAHQFAGISRDLWEELKENHPRILRPCAQTSTGRKYFLKDDIKAALIANKALADQKEIITPPHLANPPFLANR